MLLRPEQDARDICLFQIILFGYALVVVLNMPEDMLFSSYVYSYALYAQLRSMLCENNTEERKYEHQQKDQHANNTAPLFVIFLLKKTDIRLASRQKHTEIIVLSIEWQAQHFDVSTTPHGVVRVYTHLHNYKTSSTAGARSETREGFLETRGMGIILCSFPDSRRHNAYVREKAGLLS